MSAKTTYPADKEHVLSHEKSLAPVRVHPIRLMSFVQKNQLLVWVLLRLSTRDAPLVESVAVVLPSHVVAALVLFLQVDLLKIYSFVAHPCSRQYFSSLCHT